MRDHESLAAHFPTNGYPPHRLATPLPDYVLKSISGTRDVTDV
jgi:hypothetical protein